MQRDVQFVRLSGEDVVYKEKGVLDLVQIRMNIGVWRSYFISLFDNFCGYVKCLSYLEIIYVGKIELYNFYIERNFIELVWLKLFIL